MNIHVSSIAYPNGLLDGEFLLELCGVLGGREGGVLAGGRLDGTGGGAEPFELFGLCAGIDGGDDEALPR